MFNFCNVKVSPENKISDLVLINPYLGLMLEHFNINFPYKEKTIKQICIEYKISVDFFIQITKLYCGIFNEISYKITFEDIPVVISFLKKDHQYFSEEIYPSILDLIHQMKNVSNQEEIILVEKFFHEYFEEVLEHLKYENDIVFPYVIKLFNKWKGNVIEENNNEYSVSEYQEHHSDIEEKLSDLKNLLIKYLPEKGEQSLRRKLIILLYELESDLNIHSRIEDQILIPIVNRLEEYVKRENT